MEDDGTPHGGAVEEPRMDDPAAGPWAGPAPGARAAPGEPPGARTADYDFALPPALIAQTPTARRDESRLLVVERATGRLVHRTFRDIASLIAPGDALVLNTTRVVRARLLGVRDSGAPAEVLLLRPLGAGRYEAMVHPGGKLRPGRVVHVAPEVAVEILERTERRTRIVALRSPLPADVVLERYGHVPLPPYIARTDTGADTGGNAGADVGADAERYQTVYAREPGSAAAPTAGLHFTRELLDVLEQRGVQRVEVLLHVGAGTFKPVEVEDPAAHVMHEEWYAVSAAAAAALTATRAAGGCIWAVGTTSARVLESVVRADGTFAATTGETRLFIRPPYTPRGVDKLITNFHLPRSTLLMLVAAVAGYDLTRRAYREAIAAGYRFYSYGDAMAIV